MHGRNVQDLRLGLFELLVRHGAIAGSEIHRAVQDLANSAATSDGLVVDLHVRMQLVVLAEPLRIHGIRESGACPVQLGLPQKRQRERQTHQQQCDATDHSINPPLGMNMQFCFYGASVKGRLQTGEFLMNGFTLQ